MTATYRPPNPRATPAAVFAGVLILGGLLRLGLLVADPPPGTARDLSFLTDGGWYTASALDRTLGRTPDAPPAYDLPLFSRYVEFLFRVFGPTFEAARAVSFLPALLAVLFAGLAARELYGPRTGALTAALLAFDPVFVVWSRSPTVWMFLAMWSAIVLYLAAMAARRRKPAFEAATWALLLFGAFTLKESLLLLVPALVALTVRLHGARLLERRSLTGALAVAAVFLALCTVTAWLTGLHERIFQKVYDYFLAARVEGAPPVWLRPLGLESRSGLFASTPLLAACGIWGALTGLWKGERAPAALWVLAPLVVFALLAYSPIRYFLPLFPALAALAAGEVAGLDGRRRTKRAAGGGSTAGAREAAGLGEPACEGVEAASAGSKACEGATAGAHAALGPAVRSKRVSGVKGGGMQTAGSRGQEAGLSKAATVPVRRLHRERAGAGIACALVLVACVKTALAEARPTYATRHSLREVSAVLPSDARITGPGAHTLTLESRTARRFMDVVAYGKGLLGRLYRVHGVTHLTLEVGRSTADLEALHARDGAPLLYLHTFSVEGVAVNLYRLPWADTLCGRTPFEEGMAASARGDTREAASRLREAARLHPGAGAPRAALASVLLRLGERTLAQAALEEALARNPYELTALALRARLLADEGKLEDAERTLALLKRLDGRNPRLHGSGDRR